jgi:hypothetical protein
MALQPLHVGPDKPVTNTWGAPTEPKTFSRHWYDCLRALGIRQRGLYCSKGTTLVRGRLSPNFGTCGAAEKAALPFCRSNARRGI